jgi:predicted PurR-regulated permease PerM
MTDPINETPGPVERRQRQSAEYRLHQYAQLAAVVVVLVGAYLVLYPFIPAILFSAVVCSATWPLYERLRKVLWGRSGLAALVMTLLLIALVIGPSVWLTFSLADNVTAMVEAGKAALEKGPLQPPEWLRKIPAVGEMLADYWLRLVSGSESLASQLQGLLEPARNFLVGAGKAVGAGLLQLALATFIGFFFYRDGEALALALRKGLDRLAGGLGHELLRTIHDTVTGVVHGIFGTALAQALVALLGFVIAGVPVPFLLAVATFFLSILPIGPPLVWGAATLWLVFQGKIGWAIFMALWGLLAVSSIDNFVKPYLISRSSDLPILLIVLGVFGGVFAFGFIGIFIGPPVLAVGLTLVRLWIARSLEDTRTPGA